MKHSSAITLALVSVFLLSQVFGLLIVSSYIDRPSTAEAQEVVWEPLPYNVERPTVGNESTSFIPITIALVIGTLLVLVLIKYRLALVLKLWFFVVVFITLTFALAAFIPQKYAWIVALLAAGWKMFRPNIIVHNLSELFIYGGLAAIFVPLLDVFAAFMLLLVISVYDMFAVWKTGHMVKMAKFQSEARVFAGLFIPYKGGASLTRPSKKKKEGHVETMVRSRVAVLGGGDMGFPLIFAGVVMKYAILAMPVMDAFVKTLAIPLCAAAALYILLVLGERDKFYPAMPFISIGCLIGYGIFLLL